MSFPSKETPLVSIVIPCYNHAQFVQETIQSVIDQDYENIELIIIDDGSKDNSVEVIQEMIPACEERFSRFEFRHRPNKGLCATLNEALGWCEGEYFAPVASDDILESYKTSMQVNYLLNYPHSIGVFGGVKLLYEETKKIQTKVKRANKYRFKEIFLHKHNLPASTQLLRLDSVKKIGGYREDLIIEDWFMWLSLTEHGGTLDYMSAVFASYRRHAGNISSLLDKMQAGREEVVNLFSGNTLNKKALARAYMVAAHDWQNVNNKVSFFYIKKAISLDGFTLFSYRFLMYCIRGLLSVFNKARKD